MTVSIADALADRLVRYAELRPCTTAFIDARSPGSDKKENFTIIGPGVAENPDQYVHIRTPHGFNVGGARQPPHCTNSQHSHETAEVFVAHSGRWAFRTGEYAEDGEIILEPGDIISIPTGLFRGFENVGEETGFLFAVLGGNDPGKVTWAPNVLEKAKSYGLILLESGRLLDTVKGDIMPEGERAMEPATLDDLAQMRRLNDDDLISIVVRGSDIEPSSDGPLNRPGVSETPLFGFGSPAEPMPAGPLSWAHGFSLRQLKLDPGACIEAHSRNEEEVLFIQGGTLRLGWSDGSHTELTKGDTFTVPIGEMHSFAGGSEGTTVFVVRGGDIPKPPNFDAQAP
jgi:quercetin dioxygenase-like cupin family protein